MAKKTKTTSSTTQTLVTFLLDRSGSMEAIKPSTIEAFNGYKNGLKDADIKLSLVQFDNYCAQVSLEKTYIDADPKAAPDLTNSTFQPRGSTPLIDAAYTVIKAVEQKVEEALDDGKTDLKVVICIQTDGQENASREHTWAELAKLIEDKQALGWQFNFMGAGIDAYDQASKMGLSRGQTMSYNARDIGQTRAAFRASAANTMSFACGQSVGTSYSDDQKLAAGDAFDLTIKAQVTASTPKKTEGKKTFTL